MQRYLVIAVVLVFVSLICYVFGVSLAQEEEEMEDSWGTVSSISSSQIVVTEYDPDKEEEINITYTLDPNVELRNVDSLKSIVVGDDVDIEYVVRGDEKVVKVVSVEKPSYEEDTPPEAYEEQTEYSSEEIDQQESF